MKQPLGWIVVLALGAAKIASAEVSISPSVAGLFVGQEKVVEGTVAAAERDGNTVRLRLGTPPHEMTVSLIIGMLSNFPPEPERFYNGKTVRVAGLIHSFRGAVEIAVRDAADIQVVGAARVSQVAQPVDERADGAPEPPTPQRLDALGERLRALEERVQRLEGATPR